MGGTDFRKGGDEHIERIEYPIQDKEGALVDRLQSRVDNWSETVSRRIAQNVTDHIEVAVTTASDARKSYYVLGIEVPSKRPRVWANIKKLLGSWLKENGLEYYFPKGKIWAYPLEFSLFKKGGKLGKKGWAKEKFFNDTGSHPPEYWDSGTLELGRHSTVQIEDEWRGLMLETNSRRGGKTEEYLLLLHWKIDYPQGERV